MKRMSLTLKSFASVVFSAAFLMGAAHAQEEKKEEGDNAATTTQNPWFKICEENKQTKKQVCALNIQIKTKEDQPIAQVRVVEQQGAPKKLLTIVMPPGLLIQPGMRVQIDKSNVGTAKFQVCSPQACIAEAAFDANFIGRLKRGNEMNIVGIDQTRKQAGFKVTLSGFTAAYDGDPIDPKEIQAKSETLQEKLQRKADEARKRLLEEQKNEGDGASQ